MGWDGVGWGGWGGAEEEGGGGRGRRRRRRGGGGGRSNPEATIVDRFKIAETLITKIHTGLA